jgi:hypothetical protein
VVGTWGATANQTPLTIVISSQASTGKCPVITGTIFQGVSPTTLSGVYCPGSGRIVFTRTAPTLKQVYSANLSDNGQTLYMGGLFEQTDLGEYSFYAILPPPIH